MTRDKLHKKLREVLYIEDYNLVDTLLASVIANSQKIGDPVWLTIIGPSSAGKSQYIRPMAKANPELFLQVDDLTSNTLISGNGPEQSLIFQIKDVGIISMDDLTVLFSKNAEDRNAILAQFRMIYDGRMTKASGKSNGKGITWQGHAGMIAGSTPAIYKYFAEVSDMGERFINYRMKDMDADRAVDFVMRDPVAARIMDDRLVEIYQEYIAGLLQSIEPNKCPALDPKTIETIKNTALVGTKMRIPVIFDDRDKFVSEFPVPELPLRVMKQLYNLAVAFMMMHFAETGNNELPPDMLRCIEWVGYSLCDDKRRAYVRSVLALKNEGHKATLRNIASQTGLPNAALERGLPVLTSIGVLRLMGGDENSKKDRVWEIADSRIEDFIQRVDPPKKVIEELLEAEDDNNTAMGNPEPGWDPKT